MYIHNMISMDDLFQAHVSGIEILSTLYSDSNPEKEILTFLRFAFFWDGMKRIHGHQ